MPRIWKIKSFVYDRLRRIPGINRIHRLELDAARSLLNERDLDPSRIMDIGSGVGSALDCFGKAAAIIAVDSEPAMLTNIPHRPALFRVAALASALPFEESGCPFISMIGVTEYIEDKAGMLDEINRCLPVDGHCLITISRPTIWNRLRTLFGHRLFLISEAEWESLITESGLKIIASRRTLLQTVWLLRP